MKAGYEKPMIEFDEYELDSAIAAVCTTIISLAPMPYEGHSICDEYAQPLSITSRSSVPQPDNWNDSTSCTCYYSSGEIPMLTS